MRHCLVLQMLIAEIKAALMVPAVQTLPFLSPSELPALDAAMNGERKTRKEGARLRKPNQMRPQHVRKLSQDGGVQGR